jgi:hypothetical protein
MDPNITNVKFYIRYSLSAMYIVEFRVEHIRICVWYEALLSPAY